MSTTMKPTDEQQAAIDLFNKGVHVSIQAGAGAGKTSTLRLLAEGTDKSGRYMAFNKALVEEAKGYMPPNCVASTIHSAAFGAIGRSYAHRLKSQRMSSAQIAMQLGITGFNIPGPDGKPKVLQPGYLAGLVMNALKHFCQSADPEPGVKHFGYIDGIDGHDAAGNRTYTNNNAVNAYLLTPLQLAWRDATNINGTLRYDHSFYLKEWQLSNPRLPVDFLLVDEAQDIALVTLDIVKQQQDHAQVVLVGDANQRIYGFLGAVDAMSMIDAETTYLTQSFRFGQTIADVANEPLAALGSDLRLRGLESIDSIVQSVEKPDAVLTRSNAHAVELALDGIGAGKKVHIVGGGSEVVSFAYAAEKLMNFQATDHHELACFNSWDEVKQYVSEDAQGGELELMVKLIDRFRPRPIINSLSNMATEDKADLIVSTAHKSKGRAWSKVRIGSDFPDTNDSKGDPSDELRLLYVAVTRARHELDISNVPFYQVAEEEPEVEVEVANAS